MLRILIVLLVGLANTATAGPRFEFSLMDGRTIATADGPMLIVNTASRCAFTRQYDDLQTLYDTYRAEGLTVLAVPSNSFRQELATGEQVAEFCAINFDLDLPMTGITEVTGDKAHPFYQWVRTSARFTPTWNFNKVLIDAEGDVVATFGSAVAPMSARMTRAVEGLLSAG